MDVWWYPGLAFLNWAGLTSHVYHGHRLDCTFGAYLVTACLNKGIQMPVDPVVRGPVLAPLRMLLRQLGLPVWAELTPGNSYPA